MKIEKISIKSWDKKEGDQSILEQESIYPHLENIAKEVFRKSNEIGEGNFSNVFYDKETSSCSKRLKISQKQPNNVHQEAEFLHDLFEKSSTVKVPKPLFSIDAYISSNSGKISKCNILMMERIEGCTLKEVLDGEKKLPQAFKIDEFFTNLREFISEIMHEKEGVFHRDIADRNIMIEEQTGKPVIIDFGDAVYFSNTSLEEGEKDAYGHLVTERGIAPEDIDLKRLVSIEETMRTFLTKR